jgi:hypothetical protein
LINMAAALAQVGESRASEVFAQAEETTRAIPYDGLRVEALRNPAAALAQVGQYTRAEETARVITEDEVRAWVLRELAVALAKAGYFDKVLMTLGSRSLTKGFALRCGELLA